jgi:hypothetical protein
MPPPKRLVTASLVLLLDCLSVDASLAAADGAWRRVDSATRPGWLYHGRKTDAVASLTFYFRGSSLFLNHAATRNFC